MRVVVQRVSSSSVLIDCKISRSIQQGLNILLGITHEDSNSDIEWLVRKIVNLRIFADDEGVMNKSIVDIKGSFLVISQFTLHASTKKGNRPSYINAARPEIAEPLYQSFVAQLKFQSNLTVETGEFGSDMQVSIENDGPVTIIIDTINRE